MYYSVYNYYLYIDDPADDQTAEIFKNAVCDDAGNSKTAEKICRKKRSGIHAQDAGRAAATKNTEVLRQADVCRW